MSEEIEIIPGDKTLATYDAETHVAVPRDVLMKMLQQKRDLTTLFESSIDMLFVVSDLMGGRIPKTTIEMLTAIPKIMKKVKNDKALLDRFGPVLERMQLLAPQFMNEDMQSEFVKRFPTSDTKQLPNGD